MKPLTYSLFTVIILFSCSQSSKETQEDINAKYLSQAQSFIQSKIDKANKSEEVKIIGFENLKIDSSMVLSSQLLEKSKMKPLLDKFNTEKELLQKMQEIDDQFGVESSELTQASYDRCKEIIDSLQRWEARANVLPDKDTMGYAVQFKYDLKQSDGVSLKDRVYLIYFDKSHDINGDWN